MTDIGTTVTDVTVTSLTRLSNYLPQFLGGLLILLIGLIIADLLRTAITHLLRMLRVDNWLEAPRTWFGKMQESKAPQGRVWTDLVAQLVRWTVVILFLVPAVEAWGLTSVTGVLNSFLLYIPNVFVAVIVGFVGFAIANLAFDLAQNATRDLGSDSSKFLANLAKYSLIFFTLLVVLNQLGIAADLVRILFTGIVAMIAIAGGLAFGLGGQDNAKRALDELRRKLSK